MCVSSVLISILGFLVTSLPGFFIPFAIINWKQRFQAKIAKNLITTFSPGSASLIPYFLYSAFNSLNPGLNVSNVDSYCYIHYIHGIHYTARIPESRNPVDPDHRLWSLGILSLWSLIPLFWSQILLLSRIPEPTLITTLRVVLRRKQLFLLPHKNFTHITGVHQQ